MQLKYNRLAFSFMQVPSTIFDFTVTVTEALVLRPLLEDQGRITESIRILVPVDRMKQKRFQIMTKQVRRSQQFQLRRKCKWVSSISRPLGGLINFTNTRCKTKMSVVSKGDLGHYIPLTD